MGVNTMFAAVRNSDPHLTIIDSLDSPEISPGAATPSTDDRSAKLIW